MKRLSKKELLESIHNTYFISPYEAKYIYEALEELPDKGRLLELGTGQGHSTYIFSQAKPDWTIYTVDAYGASGTPPLMFGGETMTFDGRGVWETGSFIRSRGTGNVIQIVGSFDDLPWELPIDVLFIDGSHWYPDVKKDWEKFSPFLTEKGLAIMHDYNYNWGVQEFFEAEVMPLPNWEVWNKETIGFARRK